MLLDSGELTLSPRELLLILKVSPASSSSRLTRTGVAEATLDKNKSAMIEQSCAEEMSALGTVVKAER
jgi:hypothetical protein